MGAPMGSGLTVPPLIPASPGPSTPLDELGSHPGPAEMGDQLPPAIRRAYDDLCRLATQVSTDDVIDSAMLILDQPTGATGGGYAQLASTDQVGSIAVLNLGTRVMAIVASQPQSGPAPRGQGQALVQPGQLVCLPLGGSFHTIYGAQGDAAVVVRYASVRDPHVGAAGGGGSFTPNVPNPTAGGVVFYTAPFPGVIPAYLTDYEAGNSGATAARLKMFDGSVATGLEILDVAIPVGATVAQQFTRPRLLTTGILTVQTVTGDAGQPKTLVGVQ